MSCKYFTNFSKLFISYYIVKSSPLKYLKLNRLTYESMNVNCIITTKQSFFKSKHKTSLLLLWVISFLSSSESGGSNEVVRKCTKQRRAIKRAIKESDELFESNKYKQASAALLPYKECENVELLWRLSRTLYNQAQVADVPEEERKRLIHEAYNIINRALDLDDDHWAIHKWMSVLIVAESTYSGIKARMVQLERVKEHLLMAAELNPSDATLFFMLGSWCYQIADLTWMQRNIATVIFAPPPSSSFEEALYYFSKAEEIQPKSYSQNLLMLGKTLLKLHREEEAVRYLNLARTYPGTVEEDDLVIKEAKEILKKVRLKKH